MVQTDVGEALLEALEKMDPQEVTKHDYCELLAHFQSWHTCHSPLMKRAQTIIRRVHPYVQKELEEVKS